MMQARITCASLPRHARLDRHVWLPTSRKISGKQLREKSTINVPAQDGTLSVCLPGHKVFVKVRTAWTDTCSLGIACESHAENDRDIHTSRALEQEENTSERVNPSHKQSLDPADLAKNGVDLAVDNFRRHIAVKHNERATQDTTYFIDAIVPQLFAVHIVANCGSIGLAGKIKGNCEVRLREGNINAGTVRGERIQLSSGCGTIVVDELEGNVDISASKTSARLLNGARVRLEGVDDDSEVSIGAIYSSDATIATASRIKVSSCHGKLSATTSTENGEVTLGGVNGTTNVFTAGNAQVHFEDFGNSSCSNIRSGHGNIQVSVPHEAQIQLHVRGSIDHLPTSFDGTINSSSADGKLMGMKTKHSRGIGGGKVAMDEAKHQSLDNFLGKQRGNHPLPELNVSTRTGRVNVEALSWADNIARNFSGVQLPERGPKV